MTNSYNTYSSVPLISYNIISYLIDNNETIFKLLYYNDSNAWRSDSSYNMQSFEGVKPPYIGEDVDEVHWMLYVVHLGKRFSGSARAQMIDDLRACGIETVAYSHPLHQQYYYMNAGDAIGRQRGVLRDTDRIGDRALALPLHTRLDQEQVQYIIKTLKDTATNVGAGAAIYL